MGERERTNRMEREKKHRFEKVINRFLRVLRTNQNECTKYKIK